MLTRYRSVCIAALVVFVSIAPAQVGGVKIDADGILRFDSKARRGKLIEANLPAEVAARSDLRQVSLRQLDQQVRANLDHGGDLPDDLRLLAGLTAIDYVMFDAVDRDVRIAGPAEGWKIDSDGREIGVSTNRAVIHLEDLALALRTVLTGAGRIECSIDPTKEGLAAVQKVIALPWDARGEGPRRRDQVREELGRQVVTVKGVPPGTRFGRTIVEADYLMKQIAIGAVRVRGVLNHLDALVERSKRGEASIGLTRWWFTSAYEPPASDGSRCIWQIRGPRIELLNEEMMLDPDGNRSGRGAASRADRFSQDFTKAIPELETHYPVFSDLRNLYDLVFVCALIKRQGAADWLSDSILLDAKSLPTPQGTAAKLAENVATFEIHRGRDGGGKLGNYLTVAFGGVAMDAGRMLGPAGNNGPAGPDIDVIASSAFAASSSADHSTEETREDSNGQGGRWWRDLKPVDSAAPAPK